MRWSTCWASRSPTPPRSASPRRSGATRCAGRPRCAASSAGVPPWGGMTSMGWKSLGVLELTALPSIGEERWVPWVREADVLLVDGGDATYLCHWMRQSGLADLLPSLPETVWVGVSAGSMVMTPRIGDDFVEWPSAPGTTGPWGSSTSRSSRTWVTSSCRTTPWPRRSSGPPTSRVRRTPSTTRRPSRWSTAPSRSSPRGTGSLLRIAAVRPGSSTVDTTRVRDGRTGVELKPNRAGGSTGASRPRSAPSQLPSSRRSGGGPARRTTPGAHHPRCRGCEPRQRQTRATGSTTDAQAGPARCTRRGAREQPAQRRAPPTVKERASGPGTPARPAGPPGPARGPAAPRRRK